MERELPDTLPEQMRALLPDDSAAVSADEAMSIASIRATADNGRARWNGGRSFLSTLNPAASRRPAWAWLTVMAVLAAVLVLGFRALPSSKSSGFPVSRPSLPVSRTTMPVPTTIPHRATSTTLPRTSWSTWIITKAGAGQDIAPTSDGVYWLTYNVNSRNENSPPSPITPFRYAPTSGRVVKGPSLTGTVGSPAITDTGGWVWVVAGVGSDVVVEQLDTSTLTIHSTESLRVKDNLFGTVNPVLTATIGGPLWVAGGEDLWKLNPTTGAIENELDTGNQIVSMSTDPTGSLLYTGGWTSSLVGDMTVTEYGTRTGQQLTRSDQHAVSPGTVAATEGGVWVTLRTGNYGRAFELSVNGLNEIAPPSSVRTSSGMYDQIGGVEASISEGTLWLISSAEGEVATLTCADPATGSVRASESVQVGDPIARGALLYTFAGTDLVTITPSAKCFG